MQFGLGRKQNFIIKSDNDNIFKSKKKIFLTKTYFFKQKLRFKNILFSFF